MAQDPPFPNRDRLLERIDAMAGCAVLLAVDLVLDRFVTGTPKRISREAPVLILRYEGETVAAGGGGNAVANIAALGGRPLPIGFVGEDEDGDRLLAALGELGVTTDGILRLSGYRTPAKVRILGGGRHSIKQQIVRYDIENRSEPGAAGRAELGRRLERFTGESEVGVISDYGYGGADPQLLPCVRKALRRPGRLVCDSRFRLADFTGIDAATPNEEEAEALAGAPLGEHGAELLASGRAIRRRLGVSSLLVTRGSRGMTLFEEAGAASIPVHGTDQVADVTGAGDTVIGTFALALAAGSSPLEAALLADYAGGIVVMKMGTATVDRDELAAAVRSDPRPLAEATWARY